jgi:membrane protein DedA with SNARE-associated domain/rhodanese-related sulfurtransferase
MSDVVQIAEVGYTALFVWIFLEQIGVPIPGFPVLIAAGAFVSAGKLSFSLSLGLVVFACIMADLVWFYLGRLKGDAILNLLCKFSWKPDTCIGTTKGLFVRYGLSTLLFSKFVPGLNTVAPPLAGVMKMSLSRFVAYDIVGSIIWGSSALLVGMGFKELLPSSTTIWAWLRQYGVWVLLAVAVGWATQRYLRRRRYLGHLAEEIERGISPLELKTLQEAGETVTVLDVRHALNRHTWPAIVPGAELLPVADIASRQADVSLEVPIVTYCDCPKDEAAVEAAKQWQKLGAKSARVLQGGMHAWQKAGLSFEPLEETYEVRLTN